MARALVLLCLVGGPALAEDLRPKAGMAWWAKAGDLRWTTNDLHVHATSPVANLGFAWKEAVVSWNLPTSWPATIQARPVGREQAGPWYTLAHWSTDPLVAPRTSVRDQHDAVAEVDTDVLRMRQPADAIEVRLVFAHGLPPASGPVRLGVSLVAGANTEPPVPVESQAWGQLLDVPVRSQADYPEGIHSWCSPTSLTMLLAHWAKTRQLGDPALDVRPVAAGVHDPGWGGTGNWPFNTAHAGQQPGLQACVARLGGLGDLERWILAGIPVATSVSYAQLKGAPQPRPGDGHLVVVSGFSKSGDVQVHDPGVARGRVVRTFPRANFDRAWAHSSRTAYLVWPESVPAPAPALSGHRWPAGEASPK